MDVETEEGVYGNNKDLNRNNLIYEYHQHPINPRASVKLYNRKGCELPKRIKNSYLPIRPNQDLVIDNQTDQVTIGSPRENHQTINHTILEGTKSVETM